MAASKSKKSHSEFLGINAVAESYLNIVRSLILALNSEGKITFLNVKGYEILGYTQGELDGKDWFDTCLPKEIRPRLRKIFNNWVREEIVFPEPFENPVTTKNGEERWLIWHNTLVRDETGRVTGTLSSAEDITERKKAETALEENKDRLQNIMDAIEDGIVLIGLDGKVMECNRASLKQLGLTREELLGNDVTNFIVPEERQESITESRCKVQEAGEALTQVKAIRKDKSTFFAEISITSLCDKNNKRVGLIGVARDITERKKTEEALANAQVILKRQLDEIKFYYDVAPVALSIFDTNLRFVKVNKQQAEINGIPPEDHVGKSIAEVVPSVAEPLEKLLKQIISSGNPIQNLEITGEATNMPGVKRTLLESFMPMKDSKGLVTGVNVVAQEITEQKNMQAKLQEYSKNLEQLVEQRAKQLQDKERLAAIGATAGMVGHDIRNPLQAIAGDMYLIDNDVASLPEGETKECLQESVKCIQDNLLYIAKIVEDLQDYAKTLKPNLERIRIDRVIEDVMLLMRNVTPNHRVIIDVEAGFPEIVSDFSMLKRALTNLTQNAIQAMPDGGQLTLRANHKGARVFICIEDTGEGIPEEVKPKLFTPMVTTKSKGQGLGLAVVKRLVEALNGAISFESQLGKGTKFIIELPIA